MNSWTWQKKTVTLGDCAGPLEDSEDMMGDLVTELEEVSHRIEQLEIQVYRLKMWFQKKNQESNQVVRSKLSDLISDNLIEWPIHIIRVI